MEVSYQRDLNHNYMIVENPGISGGEYTVRMLEQNQIQGLLPVSVRKMDGKTYLYYEITSRQALSSIYETRKMGKRDMEQLLCGIREVLERIVPYLLDGSDLLFYPEYLYADVDSGQVWLCYLPGAKALTGRSGEGSFHALAEFLLKRLDHGDRDAVDLGYELFAQVSQDNYSLSEVLKDVVRLKRENSQIRRQNGDGRPAGEAMGQLAGRERGRESWERLPEGEAGRAAMERLSGREIGREDWAIGDQGPGELEKIRKEGGRKHNGKSTGKRCSEGKAGGKGRKEKKGLEAGGLGRGPAGKTRGRWSKKNVALCVLAVALLMTAFAGIVYFGRLDLTQTGGLAFACLAVVWGIYSVVSGKGEKKRKIWPEEDEEDEEEAYLEALMSEEYPGEEDESGYRWGGKKSAQAGGFASSGSFGGLGGGCGSPQPGGETTYLAEPELRRQFRLMSQEPEKYPDLEVRTESAVLGKKKDQVDIFIAADAVSRMHARLERSQDCAFVTDLNSMNGTFVNGERLKPNEKRPLYQGDRVSFANLHYRVKIREF